MAAREDILDALQTRLLAISTTHPTPFNTDIATVRFEARDWCDPEARPLNWIGIVPTDEVFSDFPQHVEVTWTIALICHLTPATADDDGIKNILSDVTTDVRRALYTNLTTGAAEGNLQTPCVHWVRVARRQGAEGAPEAALENIATCVIWIEVRFEEDITGV